ncbi:MULTISPECIES: ATP-binding protein [unclassified Halomonas]|uniref:ATP-binding protein n=1 Tax=unclassified Halomonas TaxID=2609666 RepID=UPI001C9653ED|nr:MULTISPECIES: ATP-binding protein [unclassified Halomonas]MBY5927421.1 response regulator [Halomonas sp. DP4Y7-2]MBY6234462.1 response regulator [Halomonas sp. DP4Y7-1]
MLSLPYRSRVAATATVMFFVAALVAGGLTFDRQQELQHRILDTVTWNLYQFDRMVREMRILVAEAPADAIDELALDFEILQGRNDLLRQGQTRAFLRQTQASQALYLQSEQLIDELAVRVGDLVAGAPLDKTARASLRQTLTQLQASSLDMLLQHKASVADIRTRDTQSLLRLYGVVLACIVLIMGAGTVLVLALMREGRAHTLKAELLQAQSRALKDAVERAESASRAKTDFMAIMSHEMRTPLSGVMGMADLLRDETLSEQGKRHIEGLEASATGLKSVINDVLDFTRLESGRIDVEQEPFALRGMLEQATLGYRSRHQSDVQFLMRLAPDLPDWVLGDLHRLRQVLQNLLNNAFKFTRQGFVMLRVSRAQDERISFVVYDTGCGISKQDVDRVFEPFEQSDSVMARRHDGAGLGLPIARNLVRAMGGDLKLDSQLGSGSRFWFELPLPACDEAALEETTHSAALEALAPHHVLVVDDNPLNSELVASMLARLGQSCERVANGEEALQVLAKREFDLVLMDLQMPVMDGWETTRRWRDKERAGRGVDGDEDYRLPIIAVTANVLPEHRRASLEAGMDDLIGKPFTRHDLACVLERYPSRVYPSLDGKGVIQQGVVHKPADGSFHDPADGSLGKTADGSLGKTADGSFHNPADGSFHNPADGSFHSPAEGSVDRPAVIASTTLQELRSMVSADALERMVRGYLARFPARIARMSQAREEGDLSVLVSEASELQHASRTLGCLAVAEVAQRLLDCVGEQRLEAVASLISELEEMGTQTGLAWRQAGVFDSLR